VGGRLDRIEALKIGAFPIVGGALETFARLGDPVGIGDRGVGQGA
jgi:hypothetical protein